TPVPGWGYQRPWGILEAAGIITPEPVSRRPRVTRSTQGTDDRNPDRILLRAVWHALHLRDRRGQAKPAWRHRHAEPRPAPFRQRFGHLPGRGHGGRALREGAALDDARARGLPSDLQLLPELPAVHLWRLL